MSTGHGEIVTRTLNSRVHDNEERLFCERCGTYAGSHDELAGVDCDHRKQIRERISGSVAEIDRNEEVE